MLNDSVGKMSSYNAVYFDFSQPKNKLILVLQERITKFQFIAKLLLHCLKRLLFSFIVSVIFSELKATPYLTQSG